MVLNATSMELVSSTRLQGIDAWNYQCEIDADTDPCPKYHGSDSDVAAVSVMRRWGYYAVSSEKRTVLCG